MFFKQEWNFSVRICDVIIVILCPICSMKTGSPCFVNHHFLFWFTFYSAPTFSGNRVVSGRTWAVNCQLFGHMATIRLAFCKGKCLMHEPRWLKCHTTAVNWTLCGRLILLNGCNQTDKIDLLIYLSFEHLPSEHVQCHLIYCRPIAINATDEMHIACFHEYV